MRIDFRNERVLAVVAHPDDADLLCAGTLARGKADGAAIGICVLCRGDKGQPDPPIEDLATVRRAEMEASAALLGAELYAGEFGDGELFDSPAARSWLTDIYRRFEPTLVFAHSLDDYHPDHRAAAAIAEAASWFCASRGHPSVGPPLSAPPQLWRMDTLEMLGFQPHIYIDISEYLDLKQSMIRCHRSQMARGTHADFAPLEDLLLRIAHARGSQSGTRAAEGFQIHPAWKRIRAW
jgi:LmbE family N-acetylglucosaminyl deacetylase